jgi:hypothetical protein
MKLFSLVLFSSLELIYLYYSYNTRRIALRCNHVENFIDDNDNISIRIRLSHHSYNDQLADYIERKKNLLSYDLVDQKKYIQNEKVNDKHYKFSYILCSITIRFSYFSYFDNSYLNGNYSFS